MRPLLALVGIFKDEAHNIAKTLASVKPFVDHYTVIDTGSTDGTAALVTAAMEGTAGSVFHEPFEDFAATRNRVLALEEAIATINRRVPGAEKLDKEPAVFSIMLSGDEVLEGGEALRAFLETHRDAPEGAYCVQRVSGNQSWLFPLVLRTDAKWRYIRPIHERPVGPNGETGTDAPLIPGVRVVHTLSNLENRKRRVREYDLPTLTRLVEDESVPLEKRREDIFFLAETHSALAVEYDESAGSARLTHHFAAMALYWRAMQLAEVAGKEAHAVFCCFRYLNVAEKAGFYGHTELIARLEALIETAPNFPELRYMLAVHAAQLDARKGLYLAQEAAKVARRVREQPQPNTLPSDSRIEWSACRIAAQCAQETNDLKKAREWARRGIEAGGPQEAFEGLL